MPINSLGNWVIIGFGKWVGPRPYYLQSLNMVAADSIFRRASRRAPSTTRLTGIVYIRVDFVLTSMDIVDVDCGEVRSGRWVVIGERKMEANYFHILVAQPCVPSYLAHSRESPDADKRFAQTGGFMVFSIITLLCRGATLGLASGQCNRCRQQSGVMSLYANHVLLRIIS